MNILIDGYNLIFECGFNGKESSPQAIERSRSRLIEELVRFMPQRERIQTTIVFDAQKLPSKESDIRSRKQDIDVFFSVGYPDADTLIEELIADHSHPKKLMVVSSDHRIQTAATRRRANAIDSGVWFDRLEKGLSLHDGKRESTVAKRIQPLSPQPQLDSDQKAAWMEVFADGLEDLNLDFDPAKPFSSFKSSPNPPKQESFKAVKRDAAKGINKSEPSEKPDAKSELEALDSEFEQAMVQLDPELIELMNEFGNQIEVNEGVDEVEEENDEAK